MSTTNNIDFVKLPDARSLIDVQPLDYPNPYDYTKLHRHSYFEIIFITNGSGEQLIDTENYEIAGGDLYMIYPGQVHLMHRRSAEGMVVQFKKNVFEYIHPVKHHNFFNKSPKISCQPKEFQHLYELSQRIQQALKADQSESHVANHKAYSYLQIILLIMLELQHARVNTDKDSLVCSEYISQITANIGQLRKVHEYAEMMGCSTDKLNDVSKRLLGKTALEVIHEELLIEIRRLLLLQELSLKEIAYSLNFDTHGNFNAFIKSKTGLTPKELQQQVQEIYK